MKHTSHPEIIKRLKRAEGHLRSLVAMMQAGRSCVELAQQMHAVESAVSNAKRELIHDHMEHCLVDGAMKPEEALREMRTLAKYL